MGKLRANVSDLTTAFFAIAETDHNADGTMMPRQRNKAKPRPIRRILSFYSHQLQQSSLYAINSARRGGSSVGQSPKLII